jgi:DNA polymerase III delta prime subunit
VKPSFSLPHLSSHSHYLIGSEKVRGELKTILQEVHGISIQGNPDFLDSVYETFAIDDARMLREIHGIRPVHISGKKIAIITMQGITSEAQNALLKLLEEPAEYAYFFLIIPSAHLLLPTVKSRLTFIETENPVSSSTHKNSIHEGEVFLKLSVPERLEVVKVLVDDIFKEKKTKQDALALLDAVERALYSKKNVIAHTSSLQRVDTAKKYMTDRAPSVKMLLEYMALSV